MFKIKADDGTNNLCGANVRRIRLSKTPRLSQRGLAARLQVMGYDVDHHMIRRIETGERIVAEIGDDTHRIVHVFPVAFQIIELRLGTHLFGVVTAHDCHKRRKYAYIILAIGIHVKHP